jgi:hypothetical protein
MRRLMSLVLGSIVGIVLVATCDKVGSSKAGGSADVTTETCDKITPDGSNYYAEHAYPGRSKIDLARAVAVVSTGTASMPSVPPGYSDVVLSLLLVKDGAVAAICNGDAGKTVTFILPQ